MQLVDSHAHLDFESFAQDRDEVISRAWEAGLVNIVTIGSGQGTDGAYAAVALAAANERLWATVGIHPHEADLGIPCKGGPKDPVDSHTRKVWEQAKGIIIERLSMLALHPKVVAIGEVGLDFHYDHSPRELQRELFRAFVRLAILRRLPLVVHSREAGAEVAEILRAEGAERVGGVIHCFSGEPMLGQAALKLGFSLGLAGPLTYKKAETLRGTVAQIPLEKLLVETDSPYLSPEPFRGKRNEPAHVVQVVKKLALLKGLPEETVAQATAQNARRLYRIEDREKRLPGKVVYFLKDGLYINLTNRCTLACRFCLKARGYEIGGQDLALVREPSSEEVMGIVQLELERHHPTEVVFCGIGEPLLRLSPVVRVGTFLKERGIRTRVNTDGLASLVHHRDVTAELAGALDCVSVSLNAPDAQTYAKICPSRYGESAFAAVCEFISRSAQVFQCVQATAVELPGVDLDKTRRLAESLGAGFRVRPLIG